MSETSTGAKGRRRRRVGAEPHDGGTDFRVWAPDHDTVHLRLEAPRHARLAMRREPSGHHSLFVPGVDAGARYLLETGDSGKGFPDPASRFQPDGPHGPSEVVDPGAYAWCERSPRIDRSRIVLYEMHVGTFTSEGTWEAAAGELARLAELGVTMLEVMPANEFAGAYGWGYDGVDLWAPTRNYGRPDDFRRFVDHAHSLGLAVILDVVYNHLGPDGCYVTQFSKHYFTSRYANEWGDAINFDGEHSAGVREFVVDNAAHWVDEYRLDGLRVDATQSMHDSGARHVLSELTAAARAAAGERSIFLVAENEPQDVRIVRPPGEGGFGFDAVWNDDFHHTAVVALTGRREAYYTDYTGSEREIVSAARHGFLYQGQLYEWQKKRRGTIARGIPRERFVWYLENHDQVANSASGRRLLQLTAPSSYRAMLAVVLLGPATPMLFQGQEFGAATPFVFFADHHPELANLVKKGRHDFVAQFPSAATPEIRSRMADPGQRSTFARCRLDRDAADERVVVLHRDLLRVRRDEKAFRGEFDAAVLGPGAFVFRWSVPDEDVILIVNLGEQTSYRPAPEPLLAPCTPGGWELVWSSEWPQYGGEGTAVPETADGWTLPARSAVLLRSR